jgi:xanthine dehydrogenase accessory factor
MLGVVTSGELFGEFAKLAAEGRPAALATVVEGSRGVGSRLLVDRDGVRGTSFADDALAARVSERAVQLLDEGSSQIFESEDVRVFIEVHLPSPRLVIVGAVHIAITLGRIAREMGFRVVVCDARDRFATPERFPEVDELILGWPNEVLPRLHLDEFSYVVVITHDAKFDNPALIAALRSPAPYVGALGSKRTHARRIKALQEAGFADEEIGRIHAPIGLEIGARTPQEIALATMAEIVAVRNGARSEP